MDRISAIVHGFTKYGILKQLEKLNRDAVYYTWPATWSKLSLPSESSLSERIIGRFLGFDMSDLAYNPPYNNLQTDISTEERS